MASRISFNAPCTTRSRIQGICSVRNLPLPFGIFTGRFGMGSYLPVTRSSKHRRKKRSPSRGFNVRETLAVDAGGTAVSFRDTIGLLKGLNVRNMHEQTPEAMRLFRLRLSINPPSQFLQIAECLCHRRVGPGNFTPSPS